MKSKTSKYINEIKVMPFKNDYSSFSKFKADIKDEILKKFPITDEFKEQYPQYVGEYGKITNYNDVYNTKNGKVRRLKLGFPHFIHFIYGNNIEKDILDIYTKIAQTYDYYFKINDGSFVVYFKDTINEIKVERPDSYEITPNMKIWLGVDPEELEENGGFSDDEINAIFLFEWISKDNKNISKHEIDEWLKEHPDLWDGNADELIEFLLDHDIIYKPLNEIKVEKPVSLPNKMEEYLDQFLNEAYNDEILEFDKYFKENTLKTLIDSGDFEINDLIANFVKDQMVFNNHHIIRGNKEILLNFSNLNLVTKQDILDYAKEHPKLNEFLYSLIKEMYIENELNPHFDKSRSELLAELIELLDEEDFDIKYYLSNAFDYYVLDPSYLDSYLDANELRSKLLKADLIKEHKINNIYTYKNNKMNTNKLRRIIRESVNDFIREIDEAGDTAAMEAKIAKCEEAIALREKKIEMSESLEEMKDLVDSTKINELKKEIKDLQKAKAKFEKAKEKRANKGKKKEVVTDGEDPEMTAEMLDMDTEMDMDSDASNLATDAEDASSLNEVFIRMQKLAGLLNESEHFKTYGKNLEVAKKLVKDWVTKWKKTHKDEPIVVDLKKDNNELYTYITNHFIKTKQTTWSELGFKLK